MLKIQIKYGFLWALLAFFTETSFAQVSDSGKTYQGLILDEVMVKAVQQGFDVKGFIAKMKQDTTYYKAFKTLRILGFKMYNDIAIYDKKESVKASYNSISEQLRKNKCRSTKFTNEKVSGDFYTRKKAYNYYTARLYAHLFFTEGVQCNDNNIVGRQKSYQGSEKYEEQLRILIFNPGQRIHGIPGIGENVAIFEEPTFSKYEFRLSRAQHDGSEGYVFKARPKEKFADNMVINRLNTYIRVADFAILARDYALSFKTLFYDFDVEMNVKLRTWEGLLVPYEIKYKGNWHVMTKSREIADFTAIFTDFTH